MQSSAAATPASNLRASLDAPLDLSAASTSDSAGSSSSSTADAPDPAASSSSFLGSDASQPPPRRRYGRPNYSDSHTNPDGSSKWTFVAGAGASIPVSTTSNDLTTGYRFQVGGGRNFNKKFGVLLQFDYDHFGFQNSTLNNLLSIYDNAGATDQTGALLSQLGGSTHMWSFTLNPIYNISQGDNWGSYVVAGVGFYHKVADFTTPATAEECSYYGCFEYQANQTIDQYVSNAPGFNGGGGVTYKFSRFTSERLFVEARYVFVDNSARQYEGTTAANSTSNNAFDAFPQNGNHTTEIPITIGVRF
jgi:hypothetical protein